MTSAPVDDRPAEAARWLAEAMETGCPLAHLPEQALPADLAQAQDTALAVLEALEITPCGLRLLYRPEGPALIGPMVEGRLVRNGSQVAPETLRHAQVTAAVVGVLAQALESDARAPAVFSKLCPALDIAASRFTTLPADPRLLTADLARIGLVVVGRARALEPGTHAVALAPKGQRPRGVRIDLAAAFREAADAARRLGGLPAGALLVVAGLSAPRQPVDTLRVQIGGIGSADASFVVQSGGSPALAAPEDQGGG